MRILIQNSLFHPDVVGGAEVSTHLLAVAMHERGWRVDALATTGRRDGPAELTARPLSGTDGEVLSAPATGLYDLYRDGAPPAPPNLLVRGLHHFANIHSPRWLRFAHEALDRVRPDVLHTNTIVGMTTAVWRAARERGLPVVHTLRDYHLLCPRTTLLRSRGTECTSPPLPCRVLAGLKLARTGGVRVVTAPSRFVLDRHLREGAFPDARGEVVPNACEEIPDPAPARTAGDPARGLYLGQLDRHKGVPQLLEALELCFAGPATDALAFDFAGAGPLADAVAAFCARHPDRARYHGVVRGEAKRELLRGAAWVVVPSVWNEPFGRTVLDAFAWSLPVIAARRGGLVEIVRDGAEGLLVEPAADELAAALRRYACDPGLRLRHGAAAGARARDFTLARQVDRFEAIYRSLATED